jgi:hypothetical protein
LSRQVLLNRIYYVIFLLPKQFWLSVHTIWLRLEKSTLFRESTQPDINTKGLQVVHAELS